jgi:hypothetical protein
LQLLKALESDLELIGRVEWRGVVLDLDTEKRDDRHNEDCCILKRGVGGEVCPARWFVDVRWTDWVVAAEGNSRWATAAGVYLGDGSRER